MALKYCLRNVFSKSVKGARFHSVIFKLVVTKYSAQVLRVDLGPLL